IVTGIEQGIYAEAYRSEEFRLIDRTAEGEDRSFSCEMDRDRLKEMAKAGGYYSYICGVASYICEWYRVGGLTIEIVDQTLPVKSGLSSSAAICVLVARAFNQLYDLHLNTSGLMNIAYWGEQRTPSRCGRLDQACAFGVAPVQMNFDGHEVEADRIPLGTTLYYVFADLMAGKDTVRILGDLNRAYPFASDEKGERLQEALGPDNLAITQRAMEYMEKGDARALGALMTEAQALFDEKVAPMCPAELTSPVLHRTLEDPEIRKLTLGGKGVGSQGDGTVQFLAKDEKSQEALYEYLTTKLKMTGYKLTLKPNSSIRRAIIPVAGFGTRLYPATRGIKKEFCPVVDKDGLVKPVLLVLIEELVNAGIEEICLILNPGEKDLYEDYFRKPLSMEHFESLPENLKEYEERFRHMAEKVSFVYQTKQLGFGHAVYQAAEFASGKPVLLLLGDTIYESHTSEVCTSQLIRAYDTYGKPMVAVQEVPLQDVQNFGIFAGAWEDKKKTVMDLDRIREKPTAGYASDFLGMPGRGRKKTSYFGAFGAYVLTREIFDELGKMCRDKEEGKLTGEVQLTEALAHVMKDSGMMGFVPEGESFDIGNARAYRSTFERFGKTAAEGDGV
ncbi:MAG: hypothetical protein IK088_02990, partial [Lachnospiraceae bacterium]|nr:hypothetical protein [Lachnospiraceae bacterium]